MTARVSVRCTACDWTARRIAAPESCPECAAAVVMSSVPGPPPAPPERQRVELRPRVLPSTAAALSAREAAEILDRAAKRRSPAG